MFWSKSRFPMTCDTMQEHGSENQNNTLDTFVLFGLTKWKNLQSPVIFVKIRFSSYQVFPCISMYFLSCFMYFMYFLASLVLGCVWPSRVSVSARLARPRLQLAKPRGTETGDEALHKLGQEKTATVYQAT